MSASESKSKKSIRGYLRDAFSRSSSHLPTPSTSSPRPITQALFSSGVPGKTNAPNLTLGVLEAPSSTGERSTTPDLKSTRPAISAEYANAQPHPLPTKESDPADVPKVTTTVTNVVWSGLRSSLQALNESGGFPGLSVVAGILLECFEGIEAAARNREDYEDLAKELATLSDTLQECTKGPTPPPMTKCISSVTSEMQHQVDQIKIKGNQGAGGRFMMAKENEEDVIRRFRRVRSLFQQLQANLSMSAWSIVNEHLVNTRLEALKPVKEATYDSDMSATVNRRKCTEGTRKQVLSGLDNWLCDEETPPVYWMNGMAGTGKTTIAYTFSERLEHREWLAASFFCTRTSADCRAVTRIIPTIAYQLARYSVPFQSALYDILGKEPDAGSKNVAKQFERLLRDPLMKVKDAIPNSIVVVVDALDECEDHSGVEKILDMLFRYGKGLPIRFFVTSRPEPDIYNRMMLDVKSRAALHLHDIETSLVQADIELFLNEELSFMSTTPSQIQQLAQRSGSLFIYAATLVRYIRFGKRFVNPHQRLQSVLSLTLESTKKHAEIDALYTAILQSALEEAQMEENEAEDVKLVLRTVLFAQVPISVDTIAALAGLDDPQRVQFALQPLRSVLHQSEDTKLVSTLHASFPDFMLSSDRSKSFFCDIVAHSQLLAERSFAVMKEQLRFNICGLESSFVPDDKVDDIQDRIKQNISPTLAYACRYWANHLALAPMSGKLVAIVDEFIRDRLLFWMEVLSLRREAAIGVEALLKTKQWLNQAGSTSPELVVLVEDASNFITGFAGSPGSRSTPHIYVSSLPFCPRSSTVYKNYWERTTGLLKLKGSLMERREAAALATWSIGLSVYSVAYSPGGTQLAVGCYDNTVRILNAHDGTMLVDPLQGHTGGVASVAFSPDGKLVASGSYGGTIRVWNAHNGTPFAGLFEGHEADAGICSVCFSPDNTKIISASWDVIRIWDVNDGKRLFGPWKDPSMYIYACILSPNGTHLAYTSPDNAVTLCNVHTQTPSGLFQGHNGTVRSLAFTPDGSRLVSGSDDRTIRVWNVSDGSLATDPFEGHTGDVNSVAVSPDGMRVASGSYDCTVRVWNIDDGSLFAGPFLGHTSVVASVRFSPDGTRVISGSWDNTIRVWNVRDGLLTSPTPFEAHLSSLQSVFLSGSSSRILSSSKDSGTWAWDLTSGEVVASIWSTTSWRFTSTNILRSDTHIPVYDDTDNTTVHVLNAADHSLIAGPLRGHTDIIVSLGVSIDSTHLVTGSRDRTIRLWDLQTSKLVSVPLRGHAGEVTSVALLPDCLRVVSASAGDRTIRVWNTPNVIFSASPSSNTSAESTDDSTSPSILDDWKIQRDGWVTNSSSDLLFWVPPDLAYLDAWPSPHAEFIITEEGILHIVQKEVLLGNRWSECYIVD